MRSNDIYLRPLRVEDAKFSYSWRNDPDVWKFTGSRPDKYITFEDEKKWIESKISLEDEARYAICVYGNNDYIGNVQLTNIANGSAEFHIFIGNKNYWNKGIGKKATKDMIEIAFNKLRLFDVYLEVKEANLPALKIYEKIGFRIVSKNASIIRMKLNIHEWEKQHG